VTDRITIKHLRARVDTLNDLFGYSRDAYATERDANGGLTANAGTYTLDCAYGGYRLCQMCQGGGERDLTGRDNARATYDAINAYIKGALAMKERLAPK
jgi:hypothetical protein